MEEQLLGGLLHYDSKLATALRFVRIGDFRSPGNQIIFATISSLATAGQRIDLVVLAEHLHGRQEIEKIGGFERLADLWDAACPANQVIRLAQKIHSPDE